MKPLRPATQADADKLAAEAAKARSDGKAEVIKAAGAVVVIVAVVEAVVLQGLGIAVLVRSLRRG